MSSVAIIADWLHVYGGAEHAIAEFAHLWPQAPIFTTITAEGPLGPLRRARLRTTPLQRQYRLLRDHRLLLPLMPRHVQDMDLRGFETILSSSHAVAKGVIPPSTAVHVCYCHTPLRYAWEMEEQYFEDFRVPRRLRLPLRRMLKRLRRWDLSTAKRVDRFIANSRETQERILRTYGRESVVIPPPVQEGFFEHPLESAAPRAYWLAVGRLVPYKRFDLIIEASNARRFPLKIVGTGREMRRLHSRAGPTVEFLGYVEDRLLPALYAGARGLLFPQHEDAGIVPLEALASGTPVVALRRGGALDTVTDGETGVFFEEQSLSSLTSALDRFERMRFPSERLRAHALPFSSLRFRERIAAAVEEAREKFLRRLREESQENQESQRK